MAKGKNKKHQSQDPEKDKPAQPPPKEKEAVAEIFDFGGLPNRDLKKNLGCG